MEEHMYKVVELVGTSPESWERAAASAVEAAARHLKDLRIGEITEQDLQIADGKVVAYRAKVKVSFRYHPEIHGE
jgi:dodecin